MAHRRYRQIVFDPRNIRYYNVLPPETVVLNDHFNAVEHRFNVVLNPPTGIVTVGDQEYIQECILQQLCQNLLQLHHVLNRDLVRLIFSHPEMRATSVSIPFINGKYLTGRNIANFVESLMNSGGNTWFYDGRFIVYFLVVRIPAGRGSNYLNNKPRYYSVLEHIFCSKSCVTINENVRYDPHKEMCCARAIVVAIAKARNYPR